MPLLRGSQGSALPPSVVPGGVVIIETAVRLSGVPLAPAGTERRCALPCRGSRILLPNAWVTFSEVLIGFACAVVAGVGLGIAVYRSPTLNRALYPIIIASQTIPIPALAPLLLVSLGYGLLPKVIVTALVGFFPIVVNTVEGLRSTDRDVVNLLRSFGASRGKVFRLAEFPSSLPSIFAGARIAVAICVIGAVFGELVGAESRSRLSDDPRHRAIRDPENGRGDRLALRDEHEPVRHGRSRRASGCYRGANTPP